jgi:hypothetical protein
MYSRRSQDSTTRSAARRISPNFRDRSGRDACGPAGESVVIKQVHVLRTTKQPAPDRLAADGSGPGLTDPAGVGYRRVAAVIDVETSQLQTRNRRNSSWLRRLRRILDRGCSESRSASDAEAAGCAHAPSGDGRGLLSCERGRRSAFASAYDAERR